MTGGVIRLESLRSIILHARNSRTGYGRLSTSEEHLGGSLDLCESYNSEGWRPCMGKAPEKKKVNL